MKNRIRAALVGLGLVASSLVGVAPASAAECHPDGSDYFCGELVVTSRSECAAISFSGWSKAIGGYGTGGSIVRPGQSSTRYHKDSDGIDPDDACRWYGATATGHAAKSVPVSAKQAKNWSGRRLVIVGVRK